MFSRAFRQRGEMVANLHRAVTQRVDLETTALDLRNYISFSSQPAHDFDALVRNYKRNQLIVYHCVLDQCAFVAECLLQFAYREKIVSCMISGGAAMLKLARDLEQLPLAFEQLAFERGVS